MAVSEVVFHTGVADGLGFACRLLRKAYRRGVRVTVTAPVSTLLALDRELWTFDERDFVPHCRVGSAGADAIAVRTPIWLLDGVPPPGAPKVLVNLGADAPQDLSPFERIIEVLTTDPEDAQAGRERWRAYKAQGLVITHHSAATGG